MKTKITCSKGLKDEDFCELEFEESLNELHVTDVRKKLIEKKLITDDSNDDEQWRFVFPMVNEKKKIPYSDRIVASSTEDYIPLNTIVKHNQVILSNCNLNKKSDLIGFKTDWFKNGKIKVKCQLKNDNQEHIKMNADKFQPIMLTDVISTNQKKSLYYGCTVVCCENSIVEFPVISYGTTGVNLRASLNGTDVYDACFNYGPYNYETYGTTYVNCMKSNGLIVDIKVNDLTKNPSIIPGTEIEYQKITIYTKDLLSWKDLDSGIVYDKNNVRPQTNFALNVENYIESESDNTQKSREQVVVPGPIVNPGGFGGGDEVHYECGRWTSGEVSEEILGAVIIYALVFKNLEAAKKFIEMYEIGRDNDYWKGEA